MEILIIALLLIILFALPLAGIYLKNRSSPLRPGDLVFVSDPHKGSAHINMITEVIEVLNSKIVVIRIEGTSTTIPRKWLHKLPHRPNLPIRVPKEPEYKSDGGRNLNLACFAEIPCEWFHLYKR